MCVLLAVSACELTELELQDNPNEVTPENAELDLLFNQAILDFTAFVDNVSDEYHAFRTYGCHDRRRPL